ncbi:cytochrome c oxidase assembly protein [Rubellimicrobium rubrum]|uniref:Cytochrome c oxidase assembly protein n=1 Tax=Rubellimicrobium rubrum TaxID=2585369 RepID=A0A5C4MVQ1_9RHOB|nr:cytochrome c oxidase assembly protein [Rubellimicrobium rubrum]TNC48448.1 cytochrome c oxidase assembly protein [Rubellimicrobium rubrum]
MTWQGAYCGPAPSPAELMSRWNLDPILLAVLALLALWVGRSRPGVAALAVLVLAFVSPLCALSSALFSARILHHVLLVAVAAPLLALARPAQAPRGAGLPFLLATAALWLWHAPAPYDAALSHKGLYALMQASLLGTAVLFWRAAFSQPGGAGALWVLLSYMAMGLLGALIAFAPQPLYATHATTPLLWDFTALADQQLAGFLMWVPAGLPFAFWGALLARRAWAQAEEPA